MKKKIEIIASDDCLIKEMIKKNSSRKFARYLKKHNYRIFVNNIECKNHEKIFTGDLLTIFYEEKGLYAPNDFDLEIRIIYEDDYVLIVNKPSGVNTIPSMNDKESLYHAILNYYAETKKENSVHFINRLDKPTSGLLIVGKDKHTALILSRELKNIKRNYLAICHGNISNQHGKIENYIYDDKELGKRCISPNIGKKAITYYRVIKKYNNQTLVRLLLKTGRTHQIRCHMAYLGHPIVGDQLYGSDNEGNLLLCSYKLTFKHPYTKENLQFKIIPPWIKE